mgnify:CR=1 FL=1|jgi:iron complex outermembrane receptor protein
MLQLILALSLVAPAAAFQGEDLLSGGLEEEFLFSGSEAVATSDLHPREARLSPANVTVITRDQIRRSGARSVADLLRRVPGLNVFRTTTGDVNVTARGHGGFSHDILLLLIDGRSTYFDFFGINFWDQLPVAIDDIERIEVSLTPGSALYGANALAGVVQIFTLDSSNQPMAVESYTLLNASVGHELSCVDGEFRLSGMNLLNDVHAELPNAAELGALVWATLTLRF